MSLARQSLRTVTEPMCSPKIITTIRPDTRSVAMNGELTDPNA